jgi:DNA-binding MarR family transcriptional regulator
MKKGKVSILTTISEIFLSWRRYHQKGILPHGITLKQLYVLHQLQEKEFLYPSEIADILYCDRPTATVVINNLRKKGWVESNRDPQNKKHIQISLSPEGLKKVREVDNSDFKQYRKFNPLEGINRQERKVLRDLLSRINKNMNQIR